jgi:hypothetical protein
VQIAKKARAGTAGTHAKRSDPTDQSHPKYPISKLPFWMPVAPTAVPITPQRSVSEQLSDI